MTDLGLNKGVNILLEKKRIHKYKQGMKKK